MGFPMTVARVLARNGIDPASTLADDVRRVAADSVTLALAALPAAPPDQPDALRAAPEANGLREALAELLAKRDASGRIYIGAGTRKRADKMIRDLAAKGFALAASAAAGEGGDDG